MLAGRETSKERFTAAAGVATTVHARGRRRCPGSGAEAEAGVDCCACVSSRSQSLGGAEEESTNGSRTGRRAGRRGPSCHNSGAWGGSLTLRLDADVQASLPWPGLIIDLSKVAKPPFPGASFFLQETRKNDQ